ncbi:MAG: tRNA preQ1(34) S-adenosylmethionine ribosyltransferase-isomerase QueA, partial [Coriobacteriia bacterium]|nr:tRNA preQ1(34) S-adenosylmethionine ribosyltransferase-isomerase QueA [Coriobacteriia bacterium]
LKEGNVIEFFDKDKHDEDAQVVLRAHIIDRIETQGGRLVRFEKSQEHMSLDEALHLVGSIPLPPYIQNYQGDTELYQTVYAMDDEHSAAAPTAGLHFTDELIEKLKAQGIKFASVELEVGIDTFRIISEENAEDHQMHTERYHVSQELVDLIEETKAAGKRVIAVGTTSVRSLESAWDSEQGRLVAKENATTDLYLMPGSSFHVVDALITNFHVPKSSLMILVSAFADRDQIMKAYETAKQEHYRFLSFGDAMFII